MRSLRTKATMVAKWAASFGKVPGPVHGIDDPNGRRVGKQAKHRRIGRGGFLSDHHRARQELCQGFGQASLGLHIGNRDEVARRLLGNISMRQPLEARDDFFGDDVADQGRDGVSVQMHPWEYRGR
jgi:hypothetical protein